MNPSRRLVLPAALLVSLTAGVLSASPAQARVEFDPAAPSARIGGTDRYETAALVATRNWSSASSVIVANGETNGIDALSASYLAGVLHAPIVLTRRGDVPSATAQAIETLHPTRVVVVGGEASVSAVTYTALTAHRVGERIAGDDRYETAELLAERAVEITGRVPMAVFIARGDLYGKSVAADALAASPWAYHEGIPVLLAAPGELPEVTADAVWGIDPGRIWALGDENAVSDDVLDDLCDLTAQCDIVRLAGDDRTQTAAEIAQRIGGGGADTVGLANGYTIDALAAGPAAGKNGYPLLLTESSTSLGSGTTDYLRSQASYIMHGKVFGDPNSISVSATETARAVAGGRPDTTPDPNAPSPVPFTIAPVRSGDTSVTVTFGGDIDPAMRWSSSGTASLRAPV